MESLDVFSASTLNVLVKLGGPLCGVSADLREGYFCFTLYMLQFSAPVPHCCTTLLFTTIQTNSHPVLILT